MNTINKLFAVLSLAVLALTSVEYASARGGGGGSNLFNSPGYQRALKESRERYSRAYEQPRVVYPARPHHRRYWRRHRR